MGSVFLRGDTGSWVIQYKDPNGKLKTETVGKKPAVTKTMARNRLEDIERSIKKNEYYEMYSNRIPKLKEITPEYIKYQKEINRKRSWKKDQNHLKRLNKIFGHKQLSEISSIDIDAYKRNRVVFYGVRSSFLTYLDFVHYILVILQLVALSSFDVGMLESFAYIPRGYKAQPLFYYWY